MTNSATAAKFAVLWARTTAGLPSPHVTCREQPGLWGREGCRETHLKPPREEMAQGNRIQVNHLHVSH
ncbi:hypothetical protein Pmani_024640 [Petrolisthes manimaculis]|uniref:Uncharacterized protein n=1 Tax=Petrolisthes manimaculis TaxID=1843537 RepID=A0AAE1TZU8_9EUCA|nr:hypothetical protein Pmani_024640 [Petrolisthes manimaculis]